MEITFGSDGRDCMDKKGDEMKGTDLIPTRQRISIGQTRTIARDTMGHLLSCWGIKNAQKISAELTKLLKTEKARRKALE